MTKNCLDNTRSALCTSLQTVNTIQLSPECDPHSLADLTGGQLGRSRGVETGWGAGEPERSVRWLSQAIGSKH